MLIPPSTDRTQYCLASMTGQIAVRNVVLLDDGPMLELARKWSMVHMLVKLKSQRKIGSRVKWFDCVISYCPFTLKSRYIITMFNALIIPR
jgi:hypothetical protein